MEYYLEYGTDVLEVHADAFPAGARVLVHDDLLATGGTASALCELVERAGAEVAGCSFLIELAGTSELDEFTKGTLSEIAKDEAFLLMVDDYLRRTRVLH